jgi:peroxiredoxin Q/BCP
MKSTIVLAAAAAFALCSAPSFATNAAPTTVPAMTLQSVIGGNVESFSLPDAAKAGPIVLYFFPKAFTSGCTIEARVFGQRLADFAKLGYTVVGVSADDIPTLTKFATAENAGQRFVSDPDAKLIDALGIGMAYQGKTYASRVTYVIGTDGTIEFNVADDVPQSNIATTMAWVQKHPYTPSGK